MGASSQLETDEQREWLAQRFSGITSQLEVLSPSQCAERHRYLPSSVTSQPGYYSFDVAPYTREIVDCLDVNSPIREVSWMKGAQICATTSVLENGLLYYIVQVKSAPIILLTAESEGATQRLNGYIMPMLQHSELDHLVQSNELKGRKTGRTEKKLDFAGGGSLLLKGAKNPAALRSDSALVLLRDEIDGYPLKVGKDGDPMKLSEARTAAYEPSRKILDLSTPTVEGASQIKRRFLRGDQRYYYVCCLKCNAAQVLRWQRVNPDTGELSGIVWDMDGDHLVTGSVRYLCQECQHPHVNSDKSRLLAPEHGAEWRPTARPVSTTVRSYHLSALYSPPGMQSWEAQVLSYMEAWDVRKNQLKSEEKHRVFYNNVLGEPYKVRGDRLKLKIVSSHRRSAYCFGEVPSAFAEEFCGSPILAVVCTVDVHKGSLKVSTWGWARESRPFLLDYWTYEGPTDDLEDAATWGRLEKLIDSHEYTDGTRRYRLACTLIDSGYRADDVYRFCSRYETGVYPIKGRDKETKSARFKEFSKFETTLRTTALHINTDHYKTRWISALKREWDGAGLQPIGHFNAPQDITDDQLKELTTETRREELDGDGNVTGYTWHRPSGAKNELWDLLVYASAALDVLAFAIHVEEEERETVVWPELWEQMAAGLFFEVG